MSGFPFLDCSESHEREERKKKEESERTENNFCFASACITNLLASQFATDSLCDGDSWPFLTSLAELAAPFSCC